MYSMFKPINIFVSESLGERTLVCHLIDSAGAACYYCWDGDIPFCYEEKTVCLVFLV